MIPVFTLERQNKKIGTEIKNAFDNVLGSGIYILGKHVSAFEEAFARFIGVRYAVGVASGTDAISLALLSIGVKPGDEVILPANSYPSVFALTAIGAIPKLVDIDPQTFTIDPELIEAAITKHTKAIIPVHMYGQAANLEPILALGKKYKIPIIEDCAQAHGAEIKMHEWKKGKCKNEWKKVGGIGDIGCFSFYPTKNLGCFGDGGMVVTNNRELAEKVRLLRMYGEKTRYECIEQGRNSRLDEVQAAILLVKLKHLEEWNKRRRDIAELYKSKVKSQKLKVKLQLPIEASYAKHIYHLFVIRSKKRDQLKTYLLEKGIQTAIHYPKPIHLQPAFKELGYKKGDFPESEKASLEVLSLPMFPELSDREVELVSKAITEFSGIR